MARGELRIYLGAAPGVGKTFAMLNEGRRRAERGVDVVVGYVETHRRPNTAAQLGDLEVVPRRVMRHRDTDFEEMDIDALLARAPGVALVDELAHTNVEGSRNAKRWQDVEELLDAGIDVISTLNVQHLESVNDVVERITGVRQQEIIPDAVVRSARQIELVDMTPEALRRRMAHGNIYGAEKIDAALTNYFRPGNLTALRELALLWVADRVDDSMAEYRERHGIDSHWETRERVVVGLTGAPTGDALIRRAARIAQRSHGEFLGVHIVSDDGLTGSRNEGLDRHRALLASLGGDYHEVVGGEPAASIVEFARAENATQIVMGASARSRWNELLRGSVINKVVRLSGDVDVHIVSHVGEGSGRPQLPAVPRRSAPSLSPRRQLVAWVLAITALPLLTVALRSTRDTIGLPTVLLLYLLLAVVVAAIGGRLPALFTAVGGFLLANWFFTPPFNTWTVSERENLLALFVFVVVAGVVATFVSTAARQTADARRARTEAEVLARLAATFDESDALELVVNHLRSTFAVDAAAVLRRRGDTWVIEAGSGQPLPSEPDQADVALPLGEDTTLAITGGALSIDDRRVLGAFADHLSAAVERRELSDAAARAEVLREGNDLRNALLQAVSHDLRTPLASIKASVSSLRQTDVSWPDTDVDEFLATIEGETDRLTNLVTNLLDLSRLQAGALQPGLRSVSLEEVIPAALQGTGAASAAVVLDLPESIPEVRADPALLERVVANLIANAVRFSPPNCPVKVRASGHAGKIEIHVVDHGPGIPVAQRANVVQPFQRLGDQSPASGTGVGLAIADGFTRAMGGDLVLEDTPGGGLTAIVRLDDAASSEAS